MAKFVFYIVDLSDATVTGTNDIEVVEQFVENDDFVVIHKDSDVYFCGNRDENDIAEVDADGLEAEDSDEAEDEGDDE